MFNVGVLLILDNGINPPKKHIHEVEVYTMRAAEIALESLMSFYKRDDTDILKNVWLRNAPKPPIGKSEQFQI